MHTSKYAFCSKATRQYNLMGKYATNSKCYADHSYWEYFYALLGMTSILVTKGAIYCENNFALSLRVTYLYDGTIMLSLEMNSKNYLALDLKIQMPHTTAQ